MSNVVDGKKAKSSIFLYAASSSKTPSLQNDPSITFGNEFIAFQFFPGSLRFTAEFPHHCQCGHSEAISPGPPGSQPDRCKGGFYRIRRPDMNPVDTGESIECE